MKEKIDYLSTLFVGIDIASRIHVISALDFNQDFFIKMKPVQNTQEGAALLESMIVDVLKANHQFKYVVVAVDAFVALTQKYVDVPELTPTIVNEYIKKIEVFAPDKSSGKRVQKVKIYFNFVDDVEIPVISEPVVAKSTPGRRKTA